MSPPPARVKVGPHRYKVAISSAEVNAEGAAQGNALSGCTDVPACEIWLAPGQAPTQMRDTVLHEVMHAIWSVTGLSSEHTDGFEEALIQRLTPALLELLRRNPALVKWLCS